MYYTQYYLVWITIIKSVEKIIHNVLTIVDNKLTMKFCAQQNHLIVTGNSCDYKELLKLIHNINIVDEIVYPQALSM